MTVTQSSTDAEAVN